MYKTIALLSLASFAFAVPAAQSTHLCNPVAIPFPDTSFQLAAYNSVTQNYTGLTITEVSRGAKILVGTPDKTLNGATEFTYVSDTNTICATGVGCDDGSQNVPLLFGSPGPSNPVPSSGGDITLKVGDGCFTDLNRQPLFAAGGPGGNGVGTSYSNDWAGWVFCQGITGVYWNGGAAPDAGCEEVALQVVGGYPSS